MGLYLRHPLSFEHDTGPHPENAERVRAIERELDSAGWYGLEIVEAPAARLEQLERVHPRAQIDSIRELSESGCGVVAPGAGADEFLALVQTVIAPLAREYRPALIGVSAGYDAHRDDPLAQCELDEAAYGDMAATLRDLAAELDVPILLCLEGGYALDALGASVSATIAALTGSVEPRRAPPEAAERQRRHLARRWESLSG